MRQVERCAVTSKHSIAMTYLRDLERELRAILEEGDEAKVIRYVKEKALESYRNGLDAVSVRVDQAAQKLERAGSSFVIVIAGCAYGDLVLYLLYLST